MFSSVLYYANQKAWLLAAFYPGVTLCGPHLTFTYFLHFLVQKLLIKEW